MPPHNVPYEYAATYNLVKEAMRRQYFAFLKYLTVVLLAILGTEASAAGSVNVLYGKKSLNKTDWQPVDSQAEYGFGVEYQKLGWPVALVASYLNSKDTGESQYPDYGFNTLDTGETAEFAIGARKYLTKNQVRVFVEGGLVSIRTEIRVQPYAIHSGDGGHLAVDTATGHGLWVGAGADILVNDALSIGVLGRASDATVTMFDVEGEAGGVHFNVFAAYHFARPKN